MALFLDSVNIEEIRSGMDVGIYSGVTTNPALLSGIHQADRLERFGEIARVCRQSIYLQVDWQSQRDMENQALTLVEVAPGRTVIKVPMAPEGLRLCQVLRARNVPVCITAVFSPGQAYAAALAGAHSVAMYVGRISRRGEDGLGALGMAAGLLQAGALPTRVLAASIPDLDSLVQALSIPGVDATIPYRLQHDLLHHPGTDEALQAFAQAARRG